MDIWEGHEQKEWGMGKPCQIRGESGETIFERQGFFSDSYLSCLLPEHLLRKERWSARIPPAPPTLTALLMQPKDRYRTVTHSTVSSFRSLAPASWAQTCDPEYSVAKASLNRDDVAAFCCWLVPSGSHRHVSLGSQVAGEDGRARHTLNSWSDTVPILAHLSHGIREGCAKCYIYLAGAGTIAKVKTL